MINWNKFLVKNKRATSLARKRLWILQKKKNKAKFYNKFLLLKVLTGFFIEFLNF